MNDIIYNIVCEILGRQFWICFWYEILIFQYSNKRYEKSVLRRFQQCMWAGNEGGGNENWESSCVDEC